MFFALLFYVVSMFAGFFPLFGQFPNCHFHFASLFCVSVSRVVSSFMYSSSSEVVSNSWGCLLRFSWFCAVSVFFALCLVLGVICLDLGVLRWIHVLWLFSVCVSGIVASVRIL